MSPPIFAAAATVLLGSLGYSPVALRAAVPLGDVTLLALSRSKAQPVVDALAEEMPATRTRKPAIREANVIGSYEAEAG